MRRCLCWWCWVLVIKKQGRRGAHRCHRLPVLTSLAVALPVAVVLAAVVVVAPRCRWWW
jgi:hypothetical protein